MEWPHKKPDYVPDEVWAGVERYLSCKEECEKFPGYDDIYDETIYRLLNDPGLEPTWKKLTEQIKDGQGWHRLLDILATLRISFDPNLWDALKECKKLAKDIEHFASKLVESIDRLDTLTNHHDIQGTPRELHSITALIEKAADNYPDFRWWERRFFTEKTGQRFPGLGGVEYKYQIPTIGLVRALCIDPSSYEIDVTDSINRYAVEGNRSLISPYVRHFDDRLSEEAAQVGVPPLNVTVSSTDLALLLSTILNMDISREAVGKARRSRKV